jgi:ADP-heptose:LPS heptosyltransferase
MSPFEDFDYHLPFGSLMRHFRKSIDDFSRSGPYLVASEEMVSDFQIRLAEYRDKPLVGICWRSGKLSPVRNLSYTALEDWRPILQSGKVTIVSLQYGEAEAEIVEVEEKLGVKIIRWHDLDQKNELDRVFAMMRCLDLVVSVNTAPLRMASALGLPVLSVEARGWTRLGQAEPKSPWFPNNHLIEPDESGRFDSRMTDIKELVEGFLLP